MDKGIVVQGGVNAVMHGDSLKFKPPIEDIGLVLTDPPYTVSTINTFLTWMMSQGRFHAIPMVLFMSVDNFYNLGRSQFSHIHEPQEKCFWVKPISTKNTKRHYSTFVEVIAMWDVKFYGGLHWSNRTGVFTDNLMSNEDHPHKKPESLIERLLRNHYPGRGFVYDPFAGSFTVDSVCRKLGIPSVSIEIDKHEVEAYAQRVGEKFEVLR